MPTDPFTGSEILPGEQVVRCPHGHINRADSWQYAGNRCSYPGCDFEGDPVSVSSSHRSHRLRWFLIVLIILAAGTYPRWSPALFSPRPFPSPEQPVLAESTIAPSPSEPSINPNSLPEPTSVATDDLLSAAFLTIERFFEVKREATRTLDGSAYYNVLAGEELQKRLEALDTLRAKNCYWDIAQQPSIQFEDYTVINPNYIQVRATIQEDANLYCIPNSNPDPGSYHAPYRMRFDLQRINGNWYITKRELVN